MKVKKMIASFMTVAITLACFSGIEMHKVYAGTTGTVLTVGNTVKFDFGGTKNVASGYIGVDSTRPYYTNGSTTLNTDINTGYTYGFFGIGTNGYNASDRTDNVVNLRFYIKIKLNKYKKTLDKIGKIFEPPSKYYIYWEAFLMNNIKLLSSI